MDWERWVLCKIITLFPGAGKTINFSDYPTATGNALNETPAVYILYYIHIYTYIYGVLGRQVVCRQYLFLHNSVAEFLCFFFLHFVFFFFNAFLMLLDRCFYNTLSRSGTKCFPNELGDHTADSNGG